MKKKTGEVNMGRGKLYHSIVACDCILLESYE